MAAPPIQFLLSPLPGWRPVPSTLGWPSTTAACDHSGVVLLDGCRISLSRPQAINLYDGFVCHDAVVVVAVTSD